MKFKKVCFSNGIFLLLIAMLWNVIFYKYLPVAYSKENFWKNIPSILTLGETVFRFLTFGFTIFLCLGLKDKLQKTGLLLYVIGINIYFGSWIAVMFFPESIWSQSLLGFTAPAYTSILWLLGIGFMGNKLIFTGISYNRIVFIVISTFFVSFHTGHAVSAYLNQY